MHERMPRRDRRRVGVGRNITMVGAHPPKPKAALPCCATSWAAFAAAAPGCLLSIEVTAMCVHKKGLKLIGIVPSNAGPVTLHGIPVTAYS